MSRNTTSAARYANSGLFGAMGMHYEVMSADLAAREVLTGGYDRVAVEMSDEVSPQKLEHAVGRIWPGTGALIVHGSRIRSQELPVDGSPFCVETEDKTVMECECLPISPTDSISAAVAAIALLKHRGERAPELSCVDLPLNQATPSRRRTRLPDAWLYATRGVEGYLKAVGDRINYGRIPEVDAAREYAMASRIFRWLKRGEKILLVGGLAHWRPIQALLDSMGRSSPDPEPRDTGTSARKIELYRLKPQVAWWRGLMDVPAIAHDFVMHMSDPKRTTIAFNVLASIAKLQRRALQRARDDEGQPIAPRQLLSYHRFLSGLQALEGRWIPELDRDLCAAAAACVSSAYADTLKSVALEYPDTPAPGVPDAQIIRSSGKTYLSVGSTAYELPDDDPTDGSAVTRRLPASALDMSPGEQKEARRLPYIRSVPTEDDLQRYMINLAWALAAKLSRYAPAPVSETQSRPFRGYWGAGIDWRRTERAWARGEPRDIPYVKIPVGAAAGDTQQDVDREAPANEPTPIPVAWLWNPNAAISEHAAACFPPQHVYSSFYWLQESRPLPGCVRTTQERVAYSVNVLRGRSSWTDEDVQALLRRLPEAQKPTVSPWRDPELKRFAGPDLAVATAVKYADRKIVVAHDFSTCYAVGAGVRTYARNRGIEIVEAPWTCFGEPELRNRLALQHTAPSRTPFTDPPPYIMRMIPAVPDFPRMPR